MSYEEAVELVGCSPGYVFVEPDTRRVFAAGGQTPGAAPRGPLDMVPENAPADPAATGPRWSHGCLVRLSLEDLLREPFKPAPARSSFSKPSGCRASCGNHSYDHHHQPFYPDGRVSTSAAASAACQEGDCSAGEGCSFVVATTYHHNRKFEPMADRTGIRTKSDASWHGGPAGRWSACSSPTGQEGQNFRVCGVDLDD